MCKKLWLSFLITSLCSQALSQTHPPHSKATIKYVSLDELRKLQNKHAGHSILIAQNENPLIKKSSPDSWNPCDNVSQPATSSPQNPEEAANFYVNLIADTQFDNGKEVLIFFAFVGVIVVAALVVYSAGFIWRALRSGYQCRTWTRWGLRYSHISDQTDTQVRRGSMSGVTFSLGYKVPRMTMALTGELGHFDMELRVNSTGQTKKFDGPYLLLGPSFDVPFSSRGHSFQIELLAGTTSEKDIGLMSTIRFGLDFRASSNTRIGLSLGAALINVKTFKGILTDLDQFNFLSGASLAYSY